MALASGVFLGHMAIPAQYPGLRKAKYGDTFCALYRFTLTYLVSTALVVSLSWLEKKASRSTTLSFLFPTFFHRLIFHTNLETSLLQPWPLSQNLLGSNTTSLGVASTVPPQT